MNLNKYHVLFMIIPPIGPKIAISCILTLTAGGHLGSIEIHHKKYEWTKQVHIIVEMYTINGHLSKHAILGSFKIFNF